MPPKKLLKRTVHRVEDQLSLIPHGKRPDTTADDGLSMPAFAQSLQSSNPLRQNIPYTKEQLFFLEYVLKYGLNAAHVRIYNETVESMAEFYTKAIANGIIKLGDTSSTPVRIEVKYVEKSAPKYTDVAEHWPHEFLKNKSVSQTLVFRHYVTAKKVYDIVSIPFMFGCKWCITAKKTPAELHRGGENAVDYRGYFIIDGTPRYIVAHEKIAHNVITTVLDEKRGYQTSLKTQDEKNNSVEYILYKTKEKEQEVYYITSGAFQRPFELKNVFKQIWILLNKLNNEDHTLPRVGGYHKFMKDTIRVVAGQNLQDFITYDWTNIDNAPIVPFPDSSGAMPATFKEMLATLFKPKASANGHDTTYEKLNQDLKSKHDFPEIVIRSIFPSITFNNEGTPEEQSRGKHDMYQAKAMLLMRMFVANVLTEQKVIRVTDRNNVGNKAYLSAAEIFRRDLTRDQGESIQSDLGGNYSPKVSVARGESNVLEVLDFSNMFEVFSSLTTLSIPRSTHSSDLAIRGVNESHTGFICPYDTPSNAMVGLTTHTAMSTSFSVPKNASIIYAIVNQVLRTYGIVDRFPTQIDEDDNADLKLLSINSVPYAMINREVFISIRNRFKRDYLFMDMVVIEDAYLTGRGTKRVEITNYNILCDSARIYRPLYNVEELIRRNLLTDGEINNYISEKTLEGAVSDGVIIMVFPSELTFKRIAMNRSQLQEYCKNYNGTDLASYVSSEFAYCEIDPLSLFSMTTSCAPMINQAPGNRCMHEPAMARSAITHGSTNNEKLSETSTKILHTGHVAPVTTRTDSVYSRYITNGVCAIIAIAIREANLEDAYEACASWAEGIVTERITTIEVTLEKGEIPGIPPGNDYRMDRYHDLDRETGLPKIGEYRGIGDAVFAKYRMETISESTTRAEEMAKARSLLEQGNYGNIIIKDDEIEQQIVNKTEFIDIGEDGYVQKIKKTIVDGNHVYRITLATTKNIQTGDKIATRFSQKGVIGAIRQAEHMPKITSGKRKGLVPDLIFSPMSLTSRATPGMLYELLLGNHAVATGKQVDASAFSMTLSRLEQYNDELVQMGYEPWGIETYKDPETEQTFQMMTGVAYVRILKHTAFEKQKACGLVNFTSIDKISRQPSKGGPTGAIRGGYMDWDTFAAHSAPHMISAMFRDQSDVVHVELCSTCGHLCDRCNRDPETVRDVRASTHCTKCDQPTIVTTKMPFCLVNIYFQLLSVGVKLSLFPGQE
jgi:DNA-directed RNA polymerase beta subunit